MTRHDILCTRAQACIDGDTATIILCDIALGRDPSDRDLDRVHPEAAAMMCAMTGGSARSELARDVHPVPRTGRATVIRCTAKATIPFVWDIAEQLKLWEAR